MNDYFDQENDELEKYFPKQGGVTWKIWLQQKMIVIYF